MTFPCGARCCQRCQACAARGGWGDGGGQRRGSQARPGRTGPDRTGATPTATAALAAMFGAIAFLASREWQEKGFCGPAVIAAAFDAYADQLTAALDGHWS